MLAELARSHELTCDHMPCALRDLILPGPTATPGQCGNPICSVDLLYRDRCRRGGTDQCRGVPSTCTGAGARGMYSCVFTDTRDKRLPAWARSASPGASEVWARGEKMAPPVMVSSARAVAIMIFFFADRAAPAAVARVDPGTAITDAIKPLVEEIAAKYQCSVSLGIRGTGATPLSVTFATGTTDRATGQAAAVTDPYVWGSVTKLVTGTGVLRLVDQGKITLDSSIPPLIDPLLATMAAKDPSQGFSSLRELWGDEVSKITVKDLLWMHSGVPDFDTASPGSHPSDSLRADVYAHPNVSFTPTQLISLPWVKTGKLLFRPGTCDRQKYFNCYSSSNFVLLGLLLACQAGVDDWRGYQQAAALGAVASKLPTLKFAVQGPPHDYTPVVGYDQTHYNNATQPKDVRGVAGVFGGWTASDVTFTAIDAATMVQAIYGPTYELISKPLVDMMYGESSETGYGLATFNLTRLTPDDVAYGHLGAVSPPFHSLPLPPCAPCAHSPPFHTLLYHSPPSPQPSRGSSELCARPLTTSRDLLSFSWSYPPSCALEIARRRMGTRVWSPTSHRLRLPSPLARISRRMASRSQQTSSAPCTTRQRQSFWAPPCPVALTRLGTGQVVASASEPQIIARLLSGARL